MQTSLHLLDYFVPESYQLSIDLLRKDRLFSGIVTIRGETISDEQKIVLHAKDLTLQSVTVDGKTADYTTEANDAVVITHPDIVPGTHIIVVQFSGAIHDQMHGLYPCYYEHDGVKKELLATQFESHHAREVFPCIDEPEAKATFDLTLTTESGVTVLGNMPIKEQTHDGDRLVTRFDTSPRMSSYLLAWIVGELHKKTALTKNNVEVNVWATPAQPAESLDFALDIAVRSIEFFDDHFGVPYPLPKSDHVALPDFSSGAMENWGLITYREVALLAHPTTTSVSGKHYIATVIAHELSHQWFGNLVTMKWWNDLWLNESFANLMEYVAVDALHPEWNVWFDFSTSETISALRRDSIDGVQSVQIDVRHPDEISTLFDPSIVYAKGGRLLRMLREFVGEDAFRRGLQAYFTAHQYKNTAAADLWACLSDASGKDIAAFMNAWLTQSGFPVVSVQQLPDGRVHLQQERFFVGPHDASDAIWPVPLRATSDDFPQILDVKEMTIDAHEADIRLNYDDTSHFVTKYDSHLLKQLVMQIQTGALDELSRLQLLHEQTLLARGGAISTDTIVPLLDAYQHETSESVWAMIALAIGELKKFVENDDTSTAQLRALAVRLAQTQYTRLGWSAIQGESESDTKLRATIIAMMLYGENPDAIATAIDLYTHHSLEDLDPELRSLIIGAYVRHSNDPACIDALIETYTTTANIDLRHDIAGALTSTKDEAVFVRLLDATKNDTIVRPQDAIHWYIGILRTIHGRSLAWDWIRSHWDWAIETFGGDKSLDYFPRLIGNSLVTSEQYSQYIAFFEPMKDDPALSRAIFMGTRDIAGRVDLIERDKNAVRLALAKQ